MFEFAAFTYGLLASFVLASFRNNRRAARPDPQLLTLCGWGLLAFSLTLSLGLSAWAATAAVSGAPV